MRSSYNTIIQRAEDTFTEKGSKFIGYAFPMDNAALLKPIINALKAEHKNARHFCYAYVCGENYEEVRSSDEGEPSGTAGRPILHQIEGRKLTNVAVVVVRYFGGVLLGTGGLMQAYKEAAKLALDKAGIQTCEICKQYVNRFTYDLQPQVMQLVKKHKIDFSMEDDYPEFQISMKIPVPLYHLLTGQLNELKE